MTHTGNYVIYHLHSDLSNGVTNIDSVTKYGEYVARAKECGMTAMGFSEHGSTFEWYHKKCAIEDTGMKYLHGVEFYVTETLQEKVRDNMHCVLIAKNYDGFLEINRLITKSFNRKDNHFYYVPRISMEELLGTSDNVVVTSACIGGILGKGSENIQEEFLDFMGNNKERCFLEVGHHADIRQILYNKKLLELSQQRGLQLIAGTDTHVLNGEHERGRSILQLSKNIEFDGEENWDLKFKTYDELVHAYWVQGSLPETAYMAAIENTNVLADMIEPFVIDRNTKYPHIYENPEETFRAKINAAIATHPYALKNHTKKEIDRVVEEEMGVYRKTKSIDFMLMQTFLREWEKDNGIQCGYGRGSVSGSMIAYILGITQMDSVKHNLNFFRFLNPDRVTNADIDTDYAGKDRDRVKRFILEEKMGLPTINSAEIITFNTIAMKGAIRDVVRALYRNDDNINYMDLAKKIVAMAESDELFARKQFPEVFKYVDIVNGTIVSIGTHPSGVLVSDLPISELLGLCTVSTSEYPVSVVNMKELDDMMYVKLDILGLDNLGVINDTCKMLGIERLTPDNTDMEDMNVWKSIRSDTTLIFQWESNSAQQYIRRFMSDKTIDIAKTKIPNFSMLKWLSFGNGLLRPACASFRDSVADGEFYDNGFDALNDLLAQEAGRIAMQETIMRFLVEFCGYSNAESDTVRRAIAKKKGTETLLPEIENRFVEYTTEHYGLTRERCEEVIKPFLQIILDASAYGFSWNHSDPYSATGYICGYLRYYYPLEFLTASLNTFQGDTEKTAKIISYAKKVGITVTSPKFGLSRDEYSCDSSSQTIAKGLASVKYMSSSASKELFELANKQTYGSFIELLKAINETTVDARQLALLVKIDFFSAFGNQRELLRIIDMFNLFKKGEAKQIKKSVVDGTPLEPIVKKYAVGITKSGGVAKSYTLLDVTSILLEIERLIKDQRMEDFPDTVKVKNFEEVMGYVGYISGKDEDRRKLYVLDTYSLKRKKDGKEFGHSIVTKSIGSGVEARFTVFNGVFNEDPISKGDIIYCKAFDRDGGYFTLLSYEKII